MNAWCTFRLRTALYGLDVALIQSVSTVPALTPIPHAPASVRGYVNLRGQIHLIVDLAYLLHGESAPDSPDTRLVLFKPLLGDPAGVLVDAIGDIVTLLPNQIEEPRAMDTGLDEELLVGIGKLDRELVVLLDARKLLPRVVGA